MRTRSTHILAALALAAAAATPARATVTIAFDRNVRNEDGAIVQKVWKATGPVGTKYWYTERLHYTDEAGRPASKDFITAARALPANAAAPPPGLDEHWTAPNTELLPASVTKIDPKPPKGAPDPAKPAPAGDGQMSFGSPEVGVSFTPIVIDTGVLGGMPGAGDADPLIGASITVSNFEVYAGTRYPGVRAFGAVFHAFDAATLSIRVGIVPVLTASIDSIESAPGEADFSADLADISINNTIGSSWLAQIQSAVAEGRRLTFDIHPAQNLALATESMVESELVSYMHSASVSVRAGITIRLDPNSPGACCCGAACIQTSALACTGSNRYFAGAGVACNPPGNNNAPCCKGDYNHASGPTARATVQDIFDFLGGYFSMDPCADASGNGGLSVQDIFDFLGAYFSGCP